MSAQCAVIFTLNDDAAEAVKKAVNIMCEHDDSVLSVGRHLTNRCSKKERIICKQHKKIYILLP